MGIHESETLDFDGPSPTGGLMPTCCLGDTLSGRYRLDEEIGRGGMGVVFRAWDVELERSVAVKVIAADLEADDARERLIREARAAAALRHPNVVAVYDVGEHEGMPFFVMELVDGRTLGEIPPNSLPEIVEIAHQICDALGHAHHNGLVHRDLKPGNVLLENRSGKTSIKIVDLGLAIRDRGVRLTQQGGITGTAAYMAPEQALGRKVDGRTDLYALGVILYQLTTGRLPFDGENALAVLSQHLHAPVVPPRTYREDLPRNLEVAILGLLAKDPDDRFADAASTAAALTLGPEADLPTPIGVTATLGGLVRGHLVGRDSELDVLRRAWKEAAAGRGGMVLVSGEPGSGKTRLARELTDYARITSGTVLSGGCYELEAATPYLPFVEALRSWVHDTSDEALRQAVAEAGAEVARLAPELSSRIGPFAEGPELSAAEQRLRLFDGVSRFLFDRAASGGLLLFIDDLQWADQASIGLLHYLVRLIGKERVLVLGCYRETELDRAHPLAEALDEWNRQRSAVRVHLGRLDPNGTSALLSALLGDECLSADFCADIHRETEGNPFFVEEVVKTLVDEGQLVCECGEWRRRDEGTRLVLPQGIKAAIGRRLDHVSESTTDVLRTAAILGKIFNFSELAAVTDRTEDDLLDALEEAEASQLVETRSGETVSFTHDKIREVLYHELNPIRRRRLHTRVARGLEDLRDSGVCVAVEDLAHHFMEGGELEKGFDHAMVAAADAATIFAYADSIRLYERARECADALDRSHELPRIDETMGDVYNVKGEPLAAARYFERSIAATDDPSETLRLKCKIGEALVLIGDSRALTFVEEAKASIDPATQPSEFARVSMIEGRFHHYHGRSRKAGEHLQVALQAAEQSGNTVLQGWILGYLAGAYQHLIQFEESNRWCQRAIDLGNRVESPGISSIGYEFMMENAFMRGLWRECLEHAHRHRALAEKASSADRLAWNSVGVAQANMGLGHLSAAKTAIEDGLELAARLGDERLAVFLGCWRAQTAVDEGRLDEAVAGADHWLDRADTLGFKSGQGEALRVRAYVARRTGDHDHVLKLAAIAESHLEGTDESVHPIWFSSIICDSLIAVGRLDDAETKIRTTLESTGKAHMPHWEALLLRERGRLFHERGDSDAARDDLASSIQILDGLGSRIELGRTLALRAALKLGSHDDLERARTLFDACGAAGDLARLTNQRD